MLKVGWAEARSPTMSDTNDEYDKNKKTVMITIPYKRPYNVQQQQGATQLLFVIMMLSILSLMGVTASKSSIIETHMANNIIETKKAMTAANSAATYAWNETRTRFDAIEFVENCEQAGMFDLRANADTSCAQSKQGQSSEAKTRTTWKTIETTANWSWNNTQQHQTMPDTLATNVSFLPSNEQHNPMKLFSTPQYATGIHDTVLLKGAENYHCMPISIIGAGQGSTQNSQALVEIKAIPKSGCFHKIIQ